MIVFLILLFTDLEKDAESILFWIDIDQMCS